MKAWVKYSLTALVSLVSLSASAVPIHSTSVIDFENLGSPGVIMPGTAHGADIKDGYSGFSPVVDLASTSPWAANGPAFSGRYAGMSTNITVYRTDGVLFEPNSVAVKSVSGDATVQFAASLNMENVGTQFRVQVSSTSWTVVHFDYGKVENFSVFALDGQRILFDDITVTSVPEPSAYAMLVAGLGLVGFAARRKRQV